MAGERVAVSFAHHLANPLRSACAMRATRREEDASSARAFVPDAWLTHHHVQTALAGMPTLGRDGAVSLVFPLDDGDALHARALLQPHGAPLVLIVHGVGGGSASGHCIRAARTCFAAGFHAVSLDLRGVGAGAALAKRLFHAGLWQDVDAVIRALALRSDVESLSILGLSMGGQLALLLAGKWGAHAPAKVGGVVAVSAPFDLAAVSRHVDAPGMRFYREVMLRSLVLQAIQLGRRHPGSLPLSSRGLLRIRNVSDYNARLVAPMHGFPDVDTYFAAASCGPWLEHVRVPTLCLHADDDPIVPRHVLDAYAPHASAAVTLRRSAHGGHLGFVQSVGVEQRVWAWDAALAFLAAARTTRAA